MLVIDGCEHTVGVNTFFCLFSVHVSLEEDSCLSLSNVVAGKEFADFLNLLLVSFICLYRFGDLVLQHNNSIVLDKEVFHFNCTVQCFHNSVVLVKQSLFGNNVCVEVVGFFHITDKYILEVFFRTEGHFSHLMNYVSSTLVVADKFNLIVLVFNQAGAHTEVRGGIVGGIQTVLAYLALFVNECPTLSVALGSTVTFEVGTVDLPCTPVTFGESLGVTTGYECIEVGRNNVASLEYKVQTLCIVTTTPLGCGVAVEQLFRTFTAKAR